MKRLGKLNLVPSKKNVIRLQDLSLELYNIIKSDTELFKKEHTIPNVNITLNTYASKITPPNANVVANSFSIPVSGI